MFAFKRDDTCSTFEGASTTNFIFLVLITFGIFVSYLPQYYRIHVKRTSEGLSTNFLLLGSSSSIFTLTNIVLVSSRARQCCYSGALSTFNCINSQLNLIQISIQCTCAIFILVLVLVLTKGSGKQDKHEYSRIVKVGKIVGAHGALAVLQVVVGFASKQSTLYIIANTNGLLSTLLTVIKYVPQIYTTYTLKHPGTLSVGMMCIQTPGGFVFTATLFFAKGSHWSSWVSYLVAALLQGSLLTLCIYYEYFGNHVLNELAERAAVERIVEENLHEQAESETEPLIEP